MLVTIRMISSFVVDQPREYLLLVDLHLVQDGFKLLSGLQANIGALFGLVSGVSGEQGQDSTVL